MKSKLPGIDETKVIESKPQMIKEGGCNIGLIFLAGIILLILKALL
jgi:hypothetical protein